MVDGIADKFSLTGKQILTLRHHEGRDRPSCGLLSLAGLSRAVLARTAEPTSPAWDDSNTMSTTTGASAEFPQFCVRWSFVTAVVGMAASTSTRCPFNAGAWEGATDISDAPEGKKGDNKFYLVLRLIDFID